MKKIILLLNVIMAAGFSLSAQEIKPETSKQFMQVDTVESVVAGDWVDPK